MCRKKLCDSCYSQTNFYPTFSLRPPGHGGAEQVEGREHHWWEEVQLEDLGTLTRLHAAQLAHHTSMYFCNKSLIKPSAQLNLIAQGILIDMTTTTPAFKTQPSSLVVAASSRAGCATISALPCCLTLDAVIILRVYICYIKSTMFTYYLIKHVSLAWLSMSQTSCKGGWVFHFQTKSLQHNFK